jgi:hypothetical protein
VAVATPPSPMQPADATTFEDRLLFSARDLFLRLRLFSVITGDLVVPEIVATDSRIRLLRDQRTDLRNWRQLLSERRRRPTRVTRNPTIRLRNARIQLAWTPNPAQHTAGDFPLDVTAACAADQPTLYDIRWRTRSPPTEDGRFLFDTQTFELRTAEGGLPTIPMASVRWASPRDLDSWLNLLDLSGQFRTDRLSYSPEQGGRAELAIERASIAAIISEEDRALPRQDRYLTFSDVHGRLAFAEAGLEVTLEGKWRGGVCRLSGRLFGDLASVLSLDDVGFELKVQAENVLLPNLPGHQSPAETRFIQRWEKLGDVVRLFRPEGRVDLNFALGKPLGRGQKPVFRGGEIIARGSSAAYLAFPYRITDLSGRVRILPEGPVVYDNLTGRHGNATVVVNGRQTESPSMTICACASMTDIRRSGRTSAPRAARISTFV